MCYQRSVLSVTLGLVYRANGQPLRSTTQLVRLAFVFRVLWWLTRGQTYCRPKHAQIVSLSWNWVPKLVLIEASTNAALTRFLQLCPASGYSRASGAETPRVWTTIARRRWRSEIYVSLSFELRTNNFKNSVLLDQIGAWIYNTIHYVSVNYEEGSKKQHH